MSDQRIVELWLAELARGSRHRPSEAAQAAGDGSNSRGRPEAPADGSNSAARETPALT